MHLNGNHAKSKFWRIPIFAYCLLPTLGRRRGGSGGGPAEGAQGGEDCAWLFRVIKSSNQYGGAKFLSICLLHWGSMSHENTCSNGTLRLLTAMTRVSKPLQSVPIFNAAEGSVPLSGCVAGCQLHGFNRGSLLRHHRPSKSSQSRLRVVAKTSTSSQSRQRRRKVVSKSLRSGHLLLLQQKIHFFYKKKTLIFLCKKILFLYKKIFVLSKKNIFFILMH